MAAWALGGGRLALPVGVDSSALTNVLAASTFALALAAAAALAGRSALMGERVSLQVALALGWFAVGPVLVSGLLPGVVPSVADAEWLRAVGLGGLLAATAILGRAVLGPPVQTDLSASRIVVELILLTVAIAAALGLLPALPPAVAGLNAGDDGLIGAAVRVVVAGGVLGGVAVSYLLAAGRRGSRFLASIGVMLVAFTLGELSLALADLVGGGWTVVGWSLRLMGAATGLSAAMAELSGAFRGERSAAFDQQTRAAILEIREHLEQDNLAEKAHDARSVILGIQAATRSLADASKGDSDHRAALAKAVDEELRRLQVLWPDRRQAPEVAPFSVTEAVAPVLVCAQAAGLSVRMLLPAQLDAIGRADDTAEVIRNLLQNAARHAPGAEVTVRGGQIGDEVLMWVDDDGPGVSQDDRQRIFERGQRGDDAGPGSGLGLFVARRLMQQQKGDLWLEDAEGPGARFVLRLAAASDQLVS